MTTQPHLHLFLVVMVIVMELTCASCFSRRHWHCFTGCIQSAVWIGEWDDGWTRCR